MARKGDRRSIDHHYNTLQQKILASSDHHDDGPVAMATFRGIVGVHILKRN